MELGYSFFPFPISRTSNVVVAVLSEHLSWEQCMLPCKHPRHKTSPGRTTWYARTLSSLDPTLLRVVEYAPASMMQSGNDFDAKDLHVCERSYAGVGARCVCYNEPAILEARRSDIIKLMLQKPERLLHHLARVGVVGAIG